MMRVAGRASYLQSMRLRRPAPLDWVIAAVVIGLGIVDVATNLTGPRWVAITAIAVFVGCVLVRSSSLWFAVVTAFATIVISNSLGLSQQNFLSSIVACLVLVWWVGYALPVVESTLGFGYAYVCVVATSAVSVANVVWLLVVIGGGWAAGRALRSRRLLIEDLRRATDELERSREQLAQRAVADERLRIAQEIHDVVAHSVTVMLVQAEAAERVMPRDRETRTAIEAVRAVQESGRNALTELRQLLGVLRPDPRPATSPQPTLRDLTELTESYQGAGLAVACRLGAISGVPSNVALTAYRVTQEALTNVLRHSEASAARVDIQRRGDCLRVEIIDHGPARPDSATSGHGLVGMRERVLACGGSLEAGPHGKGYRVVAALPLGQSA